MLLSVTRLSLPVSRLMTAGLCLGLLSAMLVKTLEANDRLAVAAAAQSIGSSELQAHVDVLADDTFEGREAGSRGGRAAAGYLVDQFEQLGLSGGGEDGGFFQPFSGRYRNLLVRLEGSDPQRKQEVIVVGAHYDHVGYGTLTNSYGPTGYIHNGADDNASGTAALVEILAAFTKLPSPPARTVLFAFWDGEEKGLLGSKHWTSHPTVPLEQVQAAINVDMIGRLEKRLRVFGTRTSRGFRQMVSRQNVALPLDLDFRWEIESNSDHYSFYQRGIPFIMLHTGLHGDYHRPSDDAHKVNAQGLRDVSRLLFQVIHELANRSQATAFRGASRHDGELGRRRLEKAQPPAPPRLGISWKATPDAPAQLTITSMSANTPAGRAGLRIGDTIIALDGRRIESGLQFQSDVLAAPNRIRLTLIRAAGTTDPGNATRPDRGTGDTASGSEPPTDRPTDPTTLDIDVPLAGRPFRIGISWREDPAEPGTVVVTRVVPGAAAHRAGLRVADRIMEVEGASFEDSGELQALVRTSAESLRLLVERRGRLKTMTLELPTIQKTETPAAGTPTS